jgi:aldose 1-epimerase
MTNLTKSPFGSLPSGEPIYVYSFANAKGTVAAITNFGGRVVKLLVPDRNGKSEDVALGFDNLDGYLAKNPYFGALVGRYANRIAGAQFTLDGRTYRLAANDGTNSLHGGTKGFDKVVWTPTEVSIDGNPALQLDYLSVDGEDGYPGNLQVRVTYRLTEGNELYIEYRAATDKKTVLNLTNHSYFDLSGQGRGNVLDHVVTVNADRFTPVDRNLIPTGELRSVEGTPFDFRRPVRVGEHIDEKNEQLKLGLGYDHNFVLNRNGNGLMLAARAAEPKSGRVLEVLTTQPGIQFYSGNHLTGSVIGKGGVVYGFRSGFCLETQHFPDSPNQRGFPSTELDPGQEYRNTTVFRFSVEA